MKTKVNSIEYKTPDLKLGIVYDVELFAAPSAS